MTVLVSVGLGLAGAGVVLIVIGAVLVRRSGARTSFGRRMAGARQLDVGDLADLGELPARPVRVRGRVRCPNPIVTSRNDQLIAYHRDVELLTPVGWRSLERVRESRGFDLWDHAGTVSVDAADAAEPLISIPYVWQGDPSELDETYRPAVERLTAAHGAPLGARSVTRTISIVDRLLVLARVRRDDAGRIRLEPPRGGYLVTDLELDDAMRLLGGPGRRILVAGAATATIGAILVVVALAMLLIGLVIG